MNRLKLMPTTSIEQEEARGRDAGDLARLRERIDERERATSAEAELVLGGDLAARRQQEREAFYAAQMDAYARQIEGDNHARWMSVALRQVLFGLGIFVAAETFLALRSTSRGAR